MRCVGRAEVFEAVLTEIAEINTMFMSLLGAWEWTITIKNTHFGRYKTFICYQPNKNILSFVFAESE